jgi:hypothetical protein
MQAGITSPALTLPAYRQVGPATDWAERSQNISTTCPGHPGAESPDGSENNTQKK